MTLNISDGRKAVRLARSAIEAHVRGQPAPDSEGSPSFRDPKGVFVTLQRARVGPDELRGCIGFPLPVKPLGEAIRLAAVAAASSDPRFPPVTTEELGGVLVEVSILTSPRPLSSTPRESLPSKIRIGVDGLIVSDAYTTGLLLPQVAVEHGMGQLEFLSQACLKAGLAPDSWLDPSTKVEVFQAQIFTERAPGGEITMVRPASDEG